MRVSSSPRAWRGTQLLLVSWVWLLAALLVASASGAEASRPPLQASRARMESAERGAEGVVAEQVELGDGVVLQLVRPAPWSDGELMDVSLRGAPGAEWAARRAWRGAGAGAELQLACARAPAGAWVSGMQSLLLDGASAMARQATGAPSLQGQAARAEAGGYRQAFTLGEDGGQGRGQHLLGFAQGGAAVLVCTLVCRGGAEMCARSVDSMKLSGQLVAEPSDTLPARTIALLAAHPSAALGALVAALLLLVSWVLARRPRPQR